MKFTLSWLNKYFEEDLKITTDELCDKLTQIGLEVEEVEEKAKDLAIFSVAKIIKATPHENSTKLQICEVEVFDPEKKSTKILQIICGAPNARSGLKVAYAAIGSVIPTNGMKIKKAKIAGVESNGMLCSAAELGLGVDGDGIIEIDDKWQIGDKITDVFGINDVVIEINVTPNRGDCLGVYAIAKDLSATGIGRLKKLNIEPSNSSYPCPVEISNQALENCSYAGFRHIKGVKNQESPDWLKKELEAIGINSISAIVDVTNYLMIALNRPMHAYDAKKIAGKLVIRQANNGEDFKSLKDLDYKLDEKMLVIADDEKNLALAGIIGGANSTCDLESDEILLEAAFFKPEIVAYAGRKLNLHSDARHRFERGVDEANITDGLNLATNLILEICGGQSSEISYVGARSELKTFIFDNNKVRSLTGIDVKIEKSIAILEKLDFAPEKQGENKILLKIPSARHDIFSHEDIVEEIIRIYGYNDIKTEPLKIDFNESKKPLATRNIRNLLASKGMIEAITWSFVNSQNIDLFIDQKIDKLNIANPISSELDYMRPNLIIGLLESCKKNNLRGFSDLSFFEIGNIFDSNGQKLVLSGLRSGKNKDENHYHDVRDFDVFDVKKDALDVINMLGVNADGVQVSSQDPLKYYHPHRFGSLKLGKNILGYFGQLHPKIAKAFGIKNIVNIFEIFIENIPQNKKGNLKKAFEAVDFQASYRDFAFLLNKEQEIGDIIKSTISLNRKLIKKVDIFDIYEGKNIDEDKKSIALRVKIQDDNKTLTSEEIDDLAQKIIENISKSFSASLRG